MSTNANSEEHQKKREESSDDEKSSKRGRVTCKPQDKFPRRTKSVSPVRSGKRGQRFKRPKFHLEKDCKYRLYKKKYKTSKKEANSLKEDYARKDAQKRQKLFRANKKIVEKDETIANLRELVQILRANKTKDLYIIDHTQTMKGSKFAVTKGYGEGDN